MSHLEAHRRDTLQKQRNSSSFLQLLKFLQFRLRGCSHNVFSRRQATPISSFLCVSTKLFSIPFAGKFPLSLFHGSLQSGNAGTPIPRAPRGTKLPALPNTCTETPSREEGAPRAAPGQSGGAAAAPAELSHPFPTATPGTAPAPGAAGCAGAGLHHPPSAAPHLEDVLVDGGPELQ